MVTAVLIFELIYMPRAHVAAAIRAALPPSGLPSHYPKREGRSVSVGVRSTYRNVHGTVTLCCGDRVWVP
jgi:hypothetical protein